MSSCLLQVEILKVKKDLIYQKDHWTKILSSFMSCVFQVWVYQFSCLTLGKDSVCVKMRANLWENAELLCCLFIPDSFLPHTGVQLPSTPRALGQSLPCRAFLGTGFLQKHLSLWAFPKHKSPSASVYISSRALLPVQ